MNSTVHDVAKDIFARPGIYRNGNLLPHFNPWPTPGSVGVNVFANHLPAPRRSIYAFPLFVLIGPLFRCRFSQDFHDAYTLVVSDFPTRSFWWAHLQALIVYFRAGEAQVWCFFFLLDFLHNGSRVAYNGTVGLFNVSASDYSFCLCYSFPGCKNFEPLGRCPARFSLLVFK